MLSVPEFSFGRLDGRVALVTGGARGIGADIADGLRSRGATVIVCDVAPATGDDATYFQCDVSDARSVEVAVGKIESEIGPIDVLINNAGILRSGPLRSSTIADIDAVINVNLRGAILCARALVGGMTARGFGRIIALTSITATRGEAHTSIYAASKGGLIGFTRSLAREVAHRGVTVNAIAPGFIDTEQTREAFSGAAGELVLRQIPARRFGTTADIVGAAVYLASDASAYMTGQVLTVDGGAT